LRENLNVNIVNKTPLRGFVYPVLPITTLIAGLPG